MKIERLTAEEARGLGGPAGLARHLRALVGTPEGLEETVREIIASVRDGGDRAVLEQTRRLDTAGKDPRPIAVPPAELDEAIKALPLDVVAGLQVAIANVAEVAQARVDADVEVALPQGQRVRVRELPVASAGVYVPGGRAPYPSTVAMGVVTARAAGVVDVAVCAPPGAEGQIHPGILGACRLCGVERVYRMGGAQAIAALAYGTDTVRRVDVVVGPGNPYVQEAKRQLSAVVGIDGYAGPSDLVVVLGAGADERTSRLVALDMLAQGEHGEGTLVVAIAVAPSDSDALLAALERNLARPPAIEGARLAVVDAPTAEDALAFAEALAPEHLQLIGSEVEALAPTVRSAGCVFIGPSAGTAFGDYVAGSNHVLPTGGAARFASMLSPRHFRRLMGEVHVGPAAAATLAKAGAPIARAEGFEWHARSMEARMGENDEPS